MSLRTPLGRVLGLGAAREGTRHFWGQRVSAIALLLLGSWFAFSMATMPGFGHADALAFIGAPLNGVLLLLLVSVLAYHSSLGIQVVVEDYVHNHALKLLALIASGFTHVFLAVAAIYGIISIGLST